MPTQLAAALEQRLAMLDRADEPLARGDDLHRALALLEELHGVGERLRLADELARLREQIDDAPARLVYRLSLELRIGLARVGLVLRLPPGSAPGNGGQAPVGSE